MSHVRNVHASQNQLELPIVTLLTTLVEGGHAFVGSARRETMRVNVEHTSVV